MTRLLGVLFLLLIAQPAAAAFVTVSAATKSQDADSTVGDIIVTLPTTATGRLLLAAVASDGSVTGHTWPVGWTQLVGCQNDAGSIVLSVAARFTDGSEGASVVVVPAGVADESVALVWEIQGAHASTLPECAIPGTGSATANPDPPASPTASWGAADNTFFAIVGLGATRTFTVAPTGYGNMEEKLTNDTAETTSAGIGAARKQSTASSDDPGTFTLSSTGAGSSAATVVVRPAAAAANKAGPLVNSPILKGLVGGGLVR